ncbi:BON domain-containing protein [Paraburkholderia phosphatilytica]|uniref:BON domain-containing protein n=1 Tax=Paraburkholderia phosphatilytica TaxID=2282883 RepID=UPI000E47AA93|nr:BON domain-containing protein [Paraburkholderia phosphatilytica]
MKAFRVLTLVSGALIVAASLNAYAQSSDTSATDTGTATSPTSMKKADRAANRKLSRDVRRALSKDKSIDTSNIKIRANHGAVVLEGTVPEQAQSDKAGTIAQGVSGVSSLKNSLTIREKGGGQ